MSNVGRIVYKSLLAREDELVIQNMGFGTERLVSFPGPEETWLKLKIWMGGFSRVDIIDTRKKTRVSITGWYAWRIKRLIQRIEKQENHEKRLAAKKAQDELLRKVEAHLEEHDN